MRSKKELLASFFSEYIRDVIMHTPNTAFDLFEEIRLRIGRPLYAHGGGKRIFLPEESGYIVTASDISATLAHMSSFSLYAFEEEIKSGYITLQGGHRVGVCGKAVVEGGRVKTIKNISSLNVRISHEVLGCADAVMPHIVDTEPRHTLIVSPPGCGKTTLLRDIIRRLGSKLYGYTVGVVDERSEIAGCYMGVPQNDVGEYTDVLDACPKAEGMLLLLRSMKPDVIAVDEIGKAEDIHAIDEIINAGAKIICTVHGSTLQDILQKPGLKQLMDKRVIERVILLSLSKKRIPGFVEGIYDGELAETAEGGLYLD